MQRSIFIFLMLLDLAQAGYAQQPDKTTRKELERVVADFMKSIKTKDSTTFYQLFHSAPVVWIGVDKEKSFLHFQQQNSQAKKNYFSSSPRSFFKGIIEDSRQQEERFYNLVMTGDERVATITFDYSFWWDGKKQNWGKESWALIRANGEWKITTVLFSIEMENVVPEPSPVKGMGKR
ncbi:hypothetical protein [Chitinophaga nivalis]|uniref:SnoaL-like domain-containing protein n=1 Tax=Chitinophaga nivalis TaxID=2991709 RepID=A0ABT3IL28_9BACT|nr:hypothetical protein [Chitinophaga nivalis]MCW3465845.1 hypothetical protein [Chitinophaga nivalis]MCW3484464.1 hypothetical protein [Chitinophaga nivalis]